MQPQPDPRADHAALASVAALAVALAAGCGSQQAPTLFPVTLRVVTDQRPMPGAQIVIRDRPQGTTDAQGSFRMRMTGTEGGVVEVTVRCPEGFVSPADAVRVPLRSAVSLDRNAHATGIETTIQCPPDQRVAAVIVRTPNRANLPVVYQGREVTRTDLQGVAHMIFKVRPRDVLAFRIDTSSQPQLRRDHVLRQHRHPLARQHHRLDRRPQPEPAVPGESRQRRRPLGLAEVAKERQPGVDVEQHVPRRLLRPRQRPPPQQPRRRHQRVALLVQPRPDQPQIVYLRRGHRALDKPRAQPLGDLMT